MKEQLRLLLEYALRVKATDIHLVCRNETLEISLRTMDGFLNLKQDIFSQPLLEYLKFISGMDLCAKWVPQSGQFSFDLASGRTSCRFSIIENKDLTTGVIRLLHTSADLPVDALTSNPKARAFLHNLSREGSGGKTTTLHAILHEMAKTSLLNIVSLEDPVEIPDTSYLQLEINEATGLTYKKGIEQLMRHDPDLMFTKRYEKCPVSKGLF